MRHTLIVVPITLLAGCAAPSFEVTPEYGYSKLSGDFAIASGSITGTTSMEDLGLDDREGLPGARVDMKWGSPHLSVAFSQTDSSGSGTTSADLTQGGTTIPAGTTVDSDIELTYGNALITFDFVPSDVVEVGIGLGVEVASIETSVVQTGLGSGIDTDETVPIPVVALRAGVAFGPIVVDGTLAGVSINYSGDSLDFYDLDLRARWKLFDHAHVLVGYKRWNVDLEYEDGSDNVLLDVNAQGPYFGVAIAF